MGTSKDTGSGRRFQTTRWSLVLRAGGQDVPAARLALESLCKQAWYPLYGYVRRRGYGPEDAQDLVQGFFARLFESGDLANVSPSRGRLRSFLLAALKHHVANHRRGTQALKRGGGVQVVSIDLEDAEGRLSAEPADLETPDRAFDRRWAQALLERVLGTLGDEFRAAGRRELFLALQPSLGGETPNLIAVAEHLGMTHGAVKVAAHRLRRRYGELLRREIAQTLDRPEDVEDEIQNLFEALGD
jgi:DNA-directed RNA polymerase specialized sigma24 family protein